MRLPLPIVAAAILSAAPLHGQVAPSDEGGRVAETSAWAARVEKDKRHFRRIDRNLASKSEPGALVRLYLKHDDVRKIEATYYGSAGRATHHYYVEDGRLRLAVLRKSIYDRPGSERVASQRSEFLWYAADSVLHWLDADGRSTPGHDNAAVTRGAAVMKDFHEKLALGPGRR